MLLSLTFTMLALSIFGHMDNFKFAFFTSLILPGLIAPALSFVFIKLLVRLDKTENEREKLIIELQDVLTKVKTLKGLLPICASCKKIRDDTGYWHQVEDFVREHSDAEFSHGICPDCAKALYPDFHLKQKACE